MSRRIVVFSFLGTSLDAGLTERRWERWRPNVALAGQQALPVSELVLFTHSEAHQSTFERVREDIAQVSPATQVREARLPLADPWDFAAVYAQLHEFCRTHPFEEGAEYYVHLATGTHVAQICLFLLTEARYFPARLLESFSHGAEEPWRGSVKVIDLDLASYDQLASRFRIEHEEATSLLKGGIRTRNAAFNALIERIEKVSLRSDAPMLLTGPTGAGKSQLAQRVHSLRRARRRLSGEFVEVNCATLRGDNAMSALFGHRKGAFTGATSDRAGLLRSADAGTLFLDEIGELGLEEQAMLLRALETGRFTPMGSDREVASRFALLAGTNRDLRHEVAAGRFRADLLARLNCWSFELPGLARRLEDLEPNLDHELGEASARLGVHVTMNAQARQAYLEFGRAYPWPGNFRDLAASVLRMATLAEGGRITAEDVALEVQVLGGGVPDRPTTEHGPLARVSLVLGERRSQFDRFELVQLEEVLAVVSRTESMAQAGRELFAVSRLRKRSSNDSDRLRKYLAGFGLEFSCARESLCRAP